MLAIPLRWNLTSMQTYSPADGDPYNEQLVEQAITVQRDFDGVSELDFEPAGTPVLSMLNRNVTETRQEFLVYMIALALRACGVRAELMSLTFDQDNRLEVKISYAGGTGNAVIRL